MAEALLVKSGGGTDSSDLTATLSQVLSGYTAMTNDSNDDPGTGTMPNRGAVTQSLNAGGSYTIPQGYHNGNGKVAANTLASQTSGNASSAQILTGYNAWVNGSNINGSMPNRGNLDFNPSGSTSQSVAAGYYSGGTLSSSNAYNAGYNAAVQSISFTLTGAPDSEVNYWHTELNSISVSKFNTISFSELTGADAHNNGGVITIKADGATLYNMQTSLPSTVNISAYSTLDIQILARYQKTMSITCTLSV